MARRISFIAVEGQHDAAFVGALLREAGFRIVTWKELNPKEPDSQFLDPAARTLVPGGFPHENNLLARVPVPFFWQKSDHVVALRPADGETKLISSILIAVRSIPPNQFSAIGVILDADKKKTPVQRLIALRKALVDYIKQAGVKNVGFSLPKKLDAYRIFRASKCGVFVMPDNLNAGTVEDLLLDCALINYSNLQSEADKYLKAIDRSILKSRDLDEITAPAGEKKALVGIIGSVLKPGKAIQVSISDNRWVNATTKAQPRVATLRTFLRDLLNEPTV
ncbi:hypothetical protein OPIT5_23235 [Opitutaceae bacterium TAV5]|nr:hypothetical protein OPIT5_23235 [Opitutaceae bacterium TAV5]